MAKNVSEELDRIRRAYAERERRFAGRDTYSLFNPGNLFIVQQRQRAVLSLLRQHGLYPLAGRRILEVGCGKGGVLLQFLSFGAEPACMHGIDLVAERLSEARCWLPHVGISCADGQWLPYPNGSFDLVLQYTVFTSILDNGVKQNVAREMLRVLKPDGLILWYDYWLNPINPDAQGIKPKEIRHLFPSCQFEFHRLTLAPPLTRVLAKYSWLICYLLEKIPLFCTNYLVAIKKSER